MGLKPPQGGLKFSYALVSSFHVHKVGAHLGLTIELF